MNRMKRKATKTIPTGKNIPANNNRLPCSVFPSEKATDDFLINFIVVINSQIQKITMRGGKRINIIRGSRGSTGKKNDSIKNASIP